MALRTTDAAPPDGARVRAIEGTRSGDRLAGLGHLQGMGRREAQ